MNFRKLLFTLNDTLKGGLVSNHLNDVKNHMEGKTNESDIHLKNLLQHAITNVNKYKDIQSFDLQSFPVVDKSIIKNDLNSFKAKNYLDKKVVTMTTSGSTGTPFTVFQDLNKKARNHADTIYFGKLAGYEIGNCLIYMKIWAKQKMSSSFTYKLQNIIPMDVLQLDDVQIQKLIDLMENHKQNYSILGYVSALEQVVRFLDKNKKAGINANVKSVITMSEGLSFETKQKLQNIFNCPVVSRYSNLENGIIAQELRDGKARFLINTASYKVEILDLKTNEPLSNGKLGKIVVTDLFNYAMPMIRYDTGDLGAMEEDNDKLYLSKVEGRKLDVLFDTKGNVVSSYIMYKNMWQYTEINQYQLIQISEKGYLFKINCPIEFKKEDQLIGEFISYLGSDADFKVEYVTEIPLLDSGKRRKTVNLYRENI
jgi:phenylacetate-CoA ligase